MFRGRRLGDSSCREADASGLRAEDRPGCDSPMFRGQTRAMRIPAAQARARFLASPVARLATADASGIPHLVPVTFAGVTDEIDLLVFAIDHKPKTTTRLRRLANIADNPSVCFLVDEYDDDWTRLWWVRADARAEVLDGTVRDAALAALTAKYRQYRDRTPTGPVVGARVVRWSGWSAQPPGDT
jgi:PPOX class probable F420-dependent enzyme